MKDEIECPHCRKAITLSVIAQQEIVPPGHYITFGPEMDMVTDEFGHTMYTPRKVYIPYD